MIENRVKPSVIERHCARLSAAQSMALYVNRALIGGMTPDECYGVTDYREEFRMYESDVRRSSDLTGLEVVPLDEIELSQDSYRQVLDQLFSGVRPWSVELPYPPLVCPAIGLTLSDFYGRYIQMKSSNGSRTLDYEVSAISDKIESVLNAKCDDDKRSAGLVVGCVQSGKTTNYTGLLLKAASRGFNVIVVLTSSNRSLAVQTSSRLAKDLKKCGLTDKYCSQINFLATGNAPLPMPHSVGDAGYFYWGVCMKESSGMERLGGWFEANRPLTPQMKVLVIDDEADNSSQDTQACRKTHLTDDEMSAVFEGMEFEEGGKYSALGRKLEGFRSHIQNDVLSAGEQLALKELSQKLENCRSWTRLFGDLLGDRTFVSLLGIGADEYDGDGNLIQYSQLLKEYFSAKGKKSLRSQATFPKMLNTILEVSIRRSRINHDLCGLLGRGKFTHTYDFPFARCVYLGYTATPYACILNETPDNTPLYAEFIFSMEKSKQYFGFSEIFGEDDSTDIPRMNIVRRFSADEVKDILQPIEVITSEAPTPSVTLDDNLNYDAGKEWTSMKKAIAWALCAAGCRRHHRINVVVPAIYGDAQLTDDEKAARINETCDRWTTMLVNISQKKDVHEYVTERIARYVALRCCSASSRRALLAECRALYEEETKAFTKARFDELFNGGSNPESRYGEIEDYPAWAEIETHVNYFMERWNDSHIHVRALNSSHKCYAEYTQTEEDAVKLQDDHLWILCGGNTISRGLTLDGLVASYFDRIHKSIAVDTMTQMSRWFGYRRGYELLPRIWMDADAIVDMKKTAIIENEMHILMKENFDNGYSPRDLEHYQMVYYYGRRLSGRDKAKEYASKAINTTFSTDDIFLRKDDVEAIHDDVSKFLTNDCGAKSNLPATEYRFSNISLWQNVSTEKVGKLFQDVLGHYPVNSQNRIESLLRELERQSRLGVLAGVASPSGAGTAAEEWEDDVEGDEVPAEGSVESRPEPLSWDVVIGEPQRGGTNRRELGGEEYLCGHPEGKAVIANELNTYGAARLNIPWFAMLPNTAINQVDRSLFEEYMDEVEKELAKRLTPDAEKIGREFALGSGLTEDNLRTRLEELLEKMKKDATLALPDCYHSSIFRDVIPGFGNRWSSSTYCTEVHKAAGHTNPVLQIYLIEPPKTCDHGFPLIALSVFWAGHSPVPFAALCAKRMLLGRKAGLSAA